MSKDGPPPFPVDVSKIKDPIPRYEPKSKCGNKPSYVVWGKRYYVMESSKGYCERGVASWYGMAFHQRKTSSGERFSTLEMTAAHKSLPLPTYAEVTNLENGKKVIVKINDRGPFCNDRIIDLSYVAAVKLGVFPKGTARVEVKAIDPLTYKRSRNRSFFSRDDDETQNALVAPKSSSSASRSRQREAVVDDDDDDVVAPLEAGSSRYVKVGEYQDSKRAQVVARQVYKVVRIHPQVIKQSDSKGIRYLVQIGPLTGASQQKRISNKLQLSGLLD